MFTVVQILVGKVAEKLKTGIKKRASVRARPLKSLVYCFFLCIKDHVYIYLPYNSSNASVYNDDFAEHSNIYLERSGQFDEDGDSKACILHSGNQGHDGFP